MTPLRFTSGRILPAALIVLLPMLSAQAASLSLDDALQLAERNAPSLQARQEQVG